MTLSQAKRLCKEMHKEKRYTDNYYLIKYPLIGWTIGTPEEFSTSKTKALDMMCYTL